MKQLFVFGSQTLETVFVFLNTMTKLFSKGQLKWDVFSYIIKKSALLMIKQHGSNCID